MKKNSLFVKIMAGAMAGVMVLIAVATLWLPSACIPLPIDQAHGHGDFPFAP